MKIGILGGGQLARMLAESAKKIGIEIICVDPNPTCSASFVADVQQCDLADISKIQQIFADVDYVTYETENLPISAIQQLSKKFKIFPNAEALKVTQDRLYEKQLFTSLNIPTPNYSPINSWPDLKNALDGNGYPCVLKTRRNGYDGKGQAIIRSSHDAKEAWDSMPTSELILEKFISYDFEVSIIAVKSKQGEIKFYPLTENHHLNGILRVSMAPHEDINLENIAHQYAKNILNKLNYVGVMTIEFFCKNGELIANEIAPRVHNSGHWTLEGADTSQFENHLRAVAGLPIGSTHANCYSAMINCISKEPENVSDLMQIHGLYYHSYDKPARHHRKLGHITICADSKSRRQSIIDESKHYFFSDD